MAQKFGQRRSKKFQQLNVYQLREKLGRLDKRSSDLHLQSARLNRHMAMVSKERAEVVTRLLELGEYD